MTPVLSVERLVKRFGGLTATDDLSITVVPGEIHAVIGPNGAGKTTLINQLSGEFFPDEGRIVFDGQDITRLPSHERSLAGVGRSYQITSVFTDFTVLQNVSLAVQGHAGHSFHFWTPTSAQRELTEPARAALAQVGLAGFEDLAARKLSQGQKRRVALARLYLAQDAPLWILDEPFTALDVRGVANLAQRIGDHLERGGVVVLTTHQDVPVPGRVRKLDLGAPPRGLAPLPDDGAADAGEHGA